MLGPSKKAIEIIDQLHNMHTRDLGWIAEYINRSIDEQNIDYEHNKIRKQIKEEIWLGIGRHKAEHYARMKLSTAVLQQKQAVEELEFIYQNWEKMAKDDPILYRRGKLMTLDAIHKDMDAENHDY